MKETRGKGKSNVNKRGDCCVNGTRVSPKMDKITEAMKKSPPVV